MTEEIVVRTKDFMMGPDVENHIQQMKKNGILEKLAQENRLTVEELQKTPLGKLCEIFNERTGHKILSGDIIIFSDTGNFEIQTGGGFAD